ncbi:MAG TPA: hypothetical protein VHH35_21705 [Pyrinomonadaceae bacterium]|nr:hypothetical protein [Pyrinomonadaceae bacterium]
MSRYLIIGLLAMFLAQDNFTLSEMIRDYSPSKNETTLRLLPFRLAGPKDRFHSLSYSIYSTFPGTDATAAKTVYFELVSVVRARRLNTDLYVAFVVDGKEIHYSSNRSAIPKPVPGRLWVGERMVFSIPREDFMKMAAAEKLGVKLGGVSFEFNEPARITIRSFAETLKN